MIWSKFIQPRLISLACTSKPIRKQREKVVPKADGTVLEIGFGSGHNLPYYNKKNIDKIIGLEPSVHMQKLSKKKLKGFDVNFELITERAEEIPLESNSIDSVVCTYTLCSISNPEMALSEIRRVLKKDGKFIFTEHAASPDLKINKFQKKIEPLWKVIADGCHLTRDIKTMLAENGFSINNSEDMYLPGTPKFIGYHIWGLLKK
ncbi:MAG: class I SAM-dependent methyltransferase [Candidatus Neomarinimicrobiota bacterium]|tara:strand:- start:84 stop:698 length:615 start_codon:yes stop_codon:yes gene_type:complete